MSPPDNRPTSVPGLTLTSLGIPADGIVSGVTLDSRAVQPGDLYVALPGHSTHGARYASQAASAGAAAILTDSDGRGLCDGIGIPIIVRDDPRGAMAQISANIYGHPGDRLHLFGITGTNGKTSTMYLVEEGLRAAGVNVGSIGTLGFRMRGAAMSGQRTTITTPEAPELQGLLATMAERGATAVVMEVSSHALDQNRVETLTFDVAGFTMLGRDHLDYHHTMEDYFAAKSRLFQPERSRHQVVNIDDVWGQRLRNQLMEAGAHPVTTGAGDEADFRVISWMYHPQTAVTSVQLDTPDGRVDFSLSLLGEFNVRNATTALAMLASAGIDLDTAARGLLRAQIPGRMQRVFLGENGPRVVVDFAHTPEAVEAALSSLDGRVIAVVGSGGDRDPAKRGPMGAAAARYADHVIVTDDNPRTENPSLIRQAVVSGARQQQQSSGAATQVVELGDRRTAIALALDSASPGDWVAILGKGHEQGQIIGTDVIPFDDVAVVHDIWNGGEHGSEDVK